MPDNGHRQLHMTAMGFRRFHFLLALDSVGSAILNCISSARPNLLSFFQGPGTGLARLNWPYSPLQPWDEQPHWRLATGFWHLHILLVGFTKPSTNPTLGPMATQLCHTHLRVHATKAEACLPLLLG
jgi:hypothetical protein